MVDMNQEQNQIFQNGGDGLRRMKKVKRPIKRFEPGGVSSPLSSQQNNINNLGTQSLNSQADLDELLDNQLNLPAINQANNNSSPQYEEEKGLQTGNYKHPDHFITEDELYQKPRFIDTLIVDNYFTIKGMALIAVLVFILGILMTKVFMGGKTIVKDGLQGVVVNAEVPRGRARCGIAERTQGCVLYIMNPQRRDLQGRDFYDLASQLTGRQRFVVETGNMRYSTVKIRPGDIAQINIPPLQ